MCSKMKTLIFNVKSEYFTVFKILNFCIFSQKVRMVGILLIDTFIYGNGSSIFVIIIVQGGSYIFFGGSTWHANGHLKKYQ